MLFWDGGNSYPCDLLPPSKKDNSTINLDIEVQSYYTILCHILL